MVCLLLVQAATANADVMKKYRAAYKSKLNYYRNQMDTEKDTFFTAWKQAAESTQLSAQRRPCRHRTPGEHRDRQVGRRRPTHAAAGRDQDSTRDKIYANIAAFKAKAVSWFKTNADKNRFKARMVTMRGRVRSDVLGR